MCDTKVGKLGPSAERAVSLSNCDHTRRPHADLHGVEKASPATIAAPVHRPRESVIRRAATDAGSPAARPTLLECKTSPLLMLSKVNGQDLSTDHAFALVRRLVEGEADK